MLKKVFFLLLILCALYGGGRLYFAVTGGFTMGNIAADLPYNAQWDTHPLSTGEKEEIGKALDQPYAYLGKGCQAYVFASADGKYVVKFFKYQRFRPQAWIDLFTFIPAVGNYQQAKAIEKKEKLDKVFTSWKIASDILKKETGVVYVHLNKTDDRHQSLAIRDKIGMAHLVDLDRTEFVLQRRATMLCPAIDQLAAEGKSDEAEKLIDRLVAMLFFEYERGYADNDHALMQNTGVLDGFPIHIDIGQFIHNDIVKSPKIYKQELYDKTYDFHRWLKKHHPDLADHLAARLVVIMGPDYFYKAPYFHKGDVAKIPHVPEA
jgi:hypothetical protein